MADMSFETIYNNTFHMFPRNSSYATPGENQAWICQNYFSLMGKILTGFYDIDIQDATWVMTTALIIFTMQTGFALVESGVVRKKNEVK